MNTQPEHPECQANKVNMTLSPLPKRYKKAPLPFIGQKRNFVRHFEQVLKDNLTDDGEGWTIVDVFGGSGLLAHNAKRLYPKAVVIYNDFDGYAQRLTHIHDTNRLRRLITDALKHHERNKLIDKDTKHQLIDVIKNFDGFVDIGCVARWLLFSGQQVSTFDELSCKSFYNRPTLYDYQSCDDYLDGLEIVHECYTKLMPKYQNNPKALLLLDPPYLYTGQGAYALDNYFAMIEFLKLMALTRPPYIFFSSTKSELLDYMDFLKAQNSDDWQRLGNYKKLDITATVNCTARYEDHMIYKF